MFNLTMYNTSNDVWGMEIEKQNKTLKCTKVRESNVWENMNKKTNRICD